MKGRIRYDIDHYNRLVAAGPHGFRAVLDGRFSVDKNNALIYNVKRPAVLPPDTNIPHKIRLTGKWSLDKNYDMKLTLDESSDGRFGDSLLFGGELVSAESDALLFSMKTKRKTGAEVRTLRLSGRWQTDYENRLAFMVEKKDGKHDAITLRGAWDIDNKHHIIYRYKKSIGSRGRKVERTIRFKGYWDVARSGSLLYVMDLRNDSLFDFRVGIGVPEFRGKRSIMKYEVGIGVAERRRPVKRVVRLYGIWRVKGKNKIRFEIGYAGGRVEAIDFGADIKFKGKNTIKLRLKDILGDDLGIELIFTRDMIDGKGYVRLERAPDEWKLSAGLHRRW